MIRTLIFIAFVGILTAAAVWLADRPGAVTLAWQGWRVDTSAAFLVFAVAAVSAAAALLYRLWLAFKRMPQAVRARRQSSHQQRGYRALTQGMVAVAAGDPNEALRQAKRADNLLGEPPLTMLLSAQAAQLNGDEVAANAYFTSMLDRPETAFLGLRGLLIQAERQGDSGKALEFANRAYELRPKTPWVLTTLFDLQAGEGQWQQALVTLEEAIRRGAVAADEGKRRKSVVLLCCSGEAEAGDQPQDAYSYARKASSLTPDFLPATLRLLSLMAAAGKNRPATRIIHNAWRRNPHPELARIYGTLTPGGDPLKKVNRFERLLEFNPEHRESHIALAEAALEAKLWGTARNHLQKVADVNPTARVCRLMAELEEAENGDGAAARQWLLRAASAEPETSWLCNVCGVTAAEWAPLCGKCESIGTLDWRTPERIRGIAFRPVDDEARDFTASSARRVTAQVGAGAGVGDGGHG